MVSDGYKSLISDGAWSSNTGNRATPESEGLTRADGWVVAYEQIGSGSTPEREVFNSREWEHTSALIDIAARGVPEWDAEVDYTPASDAACFVTTATGLHVTRMNTGPTYGNATDPDAMRADCLAALIDMGVENAHTYPYGTVQEAVMALQVHTNFDWFQCKAAFCVAS